MTWDPSSSYHLYCSLEDGQIACIDTRMNGQDAVRLFGAHGKTTSSMCFSSRVPGMLATASIDKTVRVWDVQDWQVGVTVCRYVYFPYAIPAHRGSVLNSSLSIVKRSEMNSLRQ